MEDLEKEAWFSIFWNSFKDGHMNDKDFAYLVKISKGVDVRKEVDTHLLNNPEYDSSVLNTKLRQLMQTLKIHKEMARTNEFNKKFEEDFYALCSAGSKTCDVCRIYDRRGIKCMCKKCIKKYVDNKINEEVRKRVSKIQKDAEDDMRDFMYIATSSELPISKGKEKTTPKKRKVDK